MRFSAASTPTRSNPLKTSVEAASGVIGSAGTSAAKPAGAGSLAGDAPKPEAAPSTFSVDTACT